MPIYEYRCTACNHKLDALQKISEPPLQECPSCHGQTLHKLISAASFRLKGSGWYETDFKDKHKKNIHEDTAEPSVKAPSETTATETKTPPAAASTTPSPSATTSNTSTTPAT